jgi:hypothetical protein
VLFGQTCLFSETTSATSGWCTWEVQPAAGGTITATGPSSASFTAGTTPGEYQVVGQWWTTQDGNLAETIAVSAVTVAAPPGPAVNSANYLQASGAQQTAGGTTTTNAAVVGEPVPATTAASADQSLQIRHGFLPPVTP